MRQVRAPELFDAFFICFVLCVLCVCIEGERSQSMQLSHDELYSKCALRVHVVILVGREVSHVLLHASIDNERKQNGGAFAPYGKTTLQERGR